MQTTKSNAVAARSSLSITPAQQGRVLAALLLEHGVKFKPDCAGEQAVSCFLPGHKGKGRGDKTPSMSLNLTTGVYKCQCCGVGGNDIHFMRKVRGMSQDEARDERRRLAGLDAPVKGNGAAVEKKPALAAVPSGGDWGPLPNHAALYPYPDGDGDLRFVVLRQPWGKADMKARPFIPQTPTRTAQGAAWSCGFGGKFSAGHSRPIYNLPALADGLTVHVVEGEKSCDDANALLLRAQLDAGHVAVSFSGGACAWGKTDWRPLVAAHPVKVLVHADADKAGRKCAEGLAQHLAAAGVPTGAITAVLNAGNSGEDISDLIAARGDGAAVLAFTDPDVRLCWRPRGENEPPRNQEEAAAYLDDLDVNETGVNLKDVRQRRACILETGYRFRWNVRSNIIELLDRGGEWRQITDRDHAKIGNALQGKERMVKTGKGFVPVEIGAQYFLADVRGLAALNERDLIADFLASIPAWDGRDRYKGLLESFGVVTDDMELDIEYMSTFFRSAYLRAKEPGCLVKNFLVLQGRQDVGKSSFCREIFPAWVRDEAFKELSGAGVCTGGKELRERIMGAMVVEWGEMVGGRKADINHLKNQLSITRDTFRDAYGYFSESRPRAFTFVMTSNDDTPLPNDVSGLNRFMLVRVGKGAEDVGVARQVSAFLDEHRMQLWAQAAHECIELGAHGAGLRTDCRSRHKERGEGGRAGNHGIAELIAREEREGRLVDGCPLNWMRWVAGVTKIKPEIDRETAATYIPKPGELPQRYRLIVNGRDKHLTAADRSGDLVLRSELRARGWDLKAGQRPMLRQDAQSADRTPVGREFDNVVGPICSNPRTLLVKENG